ncbi:MAG: hypothetical protein QGG53_09695 [Planctomycetota bacterium]|jgi:hypothetical protein|nr:hypothetical protein [Planctomycetota bacterium]
MPNNTQDIQWSIPSPQPSLAPGLNADLDARHAGACSVIELDAEYHIYYWGIGTDGIYRICRAVSTVDAPNEWQPRGSILQSQPNLDYNSVGPSFPEVVIVNDDYWLLYFGAWGSSRDDGKLPNRTGVAASDDGGETWAYIRDEPVIPLDRHCDCSGTGSVSVLVENGLFRMYYTSIGEYFDRPEGVKTGHGDVIPRIGIAYAESEDGIEWHKPYGELMVAPRGFDTEPYEYISSKPCVIREGEGYRMWVSTFGTAYRIRSLVSEDGLDWRWNPSGIEGELGIGDEGAFDDHQRSYACVVKHQDEYRCWYTGNGFGNTGMGYAVGRRNP